MANCCVIQLADAMLANISFCMLHENAVTQQKAEVCIKCEALCVIKKAVANVWLNETTTL